jgi:hypothetical protein
MHCHSRQAKSPVGETLHQHRDQESPIATLAEFEIPVSIIQSPNLWLNASRYLIVSSLKNFFLMNNIEMNMRCYIAGSANIYYVSVNDTFNIVLAILETIHCVSSM